MDRAADNASYFAVEESGRITGRHRMPVTNFYLVVVCVVTKVWPLPNLILSRVQMERVETSSVFTLGVY
jgi:hypothetical protein